MTNIDVISGKIDLMFWDLIHDLFAIWYLRV